MEKSRVYFIKANNYKDKTALAHKFKILIKKSGLCEPIEKGALVAIKMTLGEKDNTGFVPPEVIKTLADKIKSYGAKPFITDTNVLYHGRRSNSVDHLYLANEHGFTLENAGAPVIIADGLLGENYKDVKINKKHFKSVKIAGSISHIDYLFGVAHFTGHMLTNFGGQIKNLGMGLASRSGKLAQHSCINPKITPANCVLCRQCIRVCPVSAIIEQDNKAFIREKDCIGCGDCLIACKFNAVEFSWSEQAKVLAEKMAEYAYGAMLNIKHKAFINFSLHITKECDCLAKDDPDVCPDFGILASTDAVALDKATIDMIYQGKNQDLFKDLHPQGAGFIDQLNHAASIGLGTMEYELIEVNGK